MNSIEAPRATYSLTVQVQLDGITAPLAITADSMNEVKKAIRLLAANGLLATPPTSTTNHERISTCRSCDAPVVWRDKNGKRHPYDVVDGVPTDVSHFRTCPDRDAWSKKGTTS